ncbi:MAG: hypothetical protein ABI882_09685 [Acidobacteriota bacterium]
MDRLSISSPLSPVMTEEDFSPDYVALRAANDLIRERGKVWVFETLSRLCLEQGHELTLGRQDWRFEVGRSVMVGERVGIRYRGSTLTIEVGWPRTPADGFVPDQGLARGRISLSTSPILSAKPVEELILRSNAGHGALWYSIRNGRLGEELTERRLREHLLTVIKS